MILKTYISSCSTDDEYNDFVLLHSPQLETSSVPSNLWPALSFKLINQVYDAGSHFQMCQCISEEDDESDDDNWEVIVVKPDGIKVSDSDCIFLVDHAWTYESSGAAKSSLLECEGLLGRMCNLMNIKTENVAQDQLVEQVLREMWKYNGTYKLGTTEKGPGEGLPLWYLMDEFGSRIQHDGDPNFRLVPFYYHPTKCCFSLLFPVKDVANGEEVTRNYVETPPVDALTRDAQMLPWFHVDLTHVNSSMQQEPPLEFFNSERQAESLPSSEVCLQPLPSERKIRVYSDYEFIKLYLTDSRFEIVEAQDESDIIWISKHFKRFDELSLTPHKRINQFPCESLLTVKDLLAVVSRRSASKSTIVTTTNPPWMIPTYCLCRELVQFASNFQKREKLCLDNTWIVKPWNLARGIDHTVTHNLNHILRLPSTGPKIAQKYLDNPVLFRREDINAKVKFDFRFIVLLLSVKPLKVAVYKNFWIRFANKAFKMDDLDDYEKHFTVNNYNDKFLLQMFCTDFIREFESQYPIFSWDSIRDKIYDMIRDLFWAATRFEGPRGLVHNPQSKGSYGFDIMIDWDKDSEGEDVMQPKLLEVNFNSDCKRACEHYPEFFNDLFRVMFLDEEGNRNIHYL